MYGWSWLPASFADQKPVRNLFHLSVVASSGKSWLPTAQQSQRDIRSISACASFSLLKPVGSLSCLLLSTTAHPPQPPRIPNGPLEEGNLDTAMLIHLKSPLAYVLSWAEPQSEQDLLNNSLILIPPPKKGNHYGSHRETSQEEKQMPLKAPNKVKITLGVKGCLLSNYVFSCSNH